MNPPEIPRAQRLAEIRRREFRARREIPRRPADDGAAKRTHLKGENRREDNETDGRQRRRKEVEPSLAHTFTR